MAVMKNFLAFLLLIGIFCFESRAIFAASQKSMVFIDYPVEGANTFNYSLSDQDVPSPNMKYKISGFGLGGEYLDNHWGIGLEYENGLMAGRYNNFDIGTRFDYFNLRLIYKLLPQKNYDLFVAGSFLFGKYEILNGEQLVLSSTTQIGCLNYNINTIIIGPYLKYNINDHCLVQVFVGNSIVSSDTAEININDSGSAITSLDEETTTEIKLQVCYFITNRFGFRIGYRDYINSGKAYAKPYVVSYHNSSDIITVGVFYRF